MISKQIIDKIEEEVDQIELDKYNVNVELLEFRLIDGIFEKDKLILDIDKGEISRIDLFSLGIKSQIEESYSIPILQKDLPDRLFTSVIAFIDVAIVAAETKEEFYDKLDKSKKLPDPIGEILTYCSKDYLYQLYNIRKKYKDIWDRSLKCVYFYVGAEDYVKENGTLEKGLKRKVAKLTELTLLFSTIDSIKKYYTRLVTEEGKRIKELNKKKVKYLNCEQKLKDQFKHKYIRDLSSVLELDEDFQFELLQLIYEYNSQKYNEINERVESLSKNPIINIKSIFSKYNIKLNNEDIEDLLNIPVSNIKEILTILLKIKVLDKSIALYVLKNTSLEHLEFIEELYNEEIISSSFILENKNILDGTSKEFKTIIKNIRLIREFNIPVAIFKKNQSLLLCEDLKLKRTLEVLDQYNLLCSIKLGTDFSFIKEERLEELIDLIIEMGFEKNLISNLNLLNSDKKKWYRVMLLSENDTLFNSTSSLTKVLEDDNFIISDEDIESYVFTSVDSSINKEFNSINTLQQDEFNTLDKYKSSDLTYNINGVLISINKVKRNVYKSRMLALGESYLLQSIINNLYIDGEDITSIDEELRKYVKNLTNS